MPEVRGRQDRLRPLRVEQNVMVRQRFSRLLQGRGDAVDLLVVENIPSAVALRTRQGLRAVIVRGIAFSAPFAATVNASPDMLGGRPFRPSGMTIIATAGPGRKELVTPGCCLVEPSRGRSCP